MRYTDLGPVSNLPNERAGLLVAEFVWLRFLGGGAETFPHYGQRFRPEVHTLHQAELLSFTAGLGAL